MQDVWRVGPEVGGEEVADGGFGDLFEVGLQFGLFGAPGEVGGDIPQPTAEELSKYFEARKLLFRAPEYRKIATVAGDAGRALAKWMEISDADVKRAYDERPQPATSRRSAAMSSRSCSRTWRTRKPPRRTLKDGLTFAALAAERGLKEQDIDLGTVAKSGIIDPTVADAASRSRKAKSARRSQGRSARSSSPYSRSSPKTTNRSPKSTPQIRNDIALERAKAEVQEPARQDRGRARRRQHRSKRPRQKLKLPVVTFDVDRSGRDPTASRSPTCRTPATHQRRVRFRCRRRQRPDRRPTAAMSGMTSPPSRRRTTARSTRSRATVERAGATTRSLRGSRPRRPTCSTSSRAASRSTHLPRPTA